MLNKQSSMGDSDELYEVLQQGYRYAFSLTHHEDDAYDLVQNVYLNLVEKKKPLVISYLITSIRNLFIDQQRKRGLQQELYRTRSKNDAIAPRVGAEPYLDKIMAALSSRDREILFLAIVEEYTAQEIAELLQIPRGTVLSILSRTKSKLKQQLEERNDLAL